MGFIPERLLMMMMMMTFPPHPPRLQPGPAHVVPAAGLLIFPNGTRIWRHRMSNGTEQVRTTVYQSWQCAPAEGNGAYYATFAETSHSTTWPPSNASEYVY